MTNPTVRAHEGQRLRHPMPIRFTLHPPQDGAKQMRAHYMATSWSGCGIGTTASVRSGSKLWS